MKILVVNHYAGSNRMGMEFRPFHFAREWVALGHSVTIVAADFSHLRMEQPTVQKDLEATEEDGVCYRWLRTNRYKGNGAARVASMLIFAGKLLKHSGFLAQVEQPEVVICSSTYPLDIFGGARLAAKCGAKLVFEVHDLWPLTPVLLGGHSPRNPFIRFLQYAEDWAYHRADKVVSILPDACGYMVSRGLDPRKFIHIPNGVAVQDIETGEPAPLPAGPLADLIEREKKQGRFLVGYAGGITRSMAIETLVDAADRLKDCNITFVLVGDGPEAEQVRRKIAQMGITSIEMPGRIPKSQVLAFLMRMDILVIPWHRSRLYQYGVSPNKLFEYMAAGRPILQSSEASNDLVSNADCGLTVAPGEPDAFATAIRKLRALSNLELRRLGDNGRRFVAERHNCRLLAQRFLREVTDDSGAVKQAICNTPLPIHCRRGAAEPMGEEASRRWRQHR